MYWKSALRDIMLQCFYKNCYLYEIVYNRQIASLSNIFASPLFDWKVHSSKWDIDIRKQSYVYVFALIVARIYLLLFNITRNSKYRSWIQSFAICMCRQMHAHMFIINYNCYKKLHRSDYDYNADAIKVAQFSRTQNK